MAVTLHNRAARCCAPQSGSAARAVLAAGATLWAQAIFAAQPPCPPAQACPPVVCPPSSTQPGVPQPSMQLPSPDRLFSPNSPDSLTNPNTTTPNTGTPNTSDPSQPNMSNQNAPQQNQPAPQNNLNNQLAQGGAQSNLRSTPAMIGDFLGVGGGTYFMPTTAAAQVAVAIVGPDGYYFRQLQYSPAGGAGNLINTQNSVFLGTSGSQFVNTAFDSGTRSISNLNGYNGAAFDGTAAGVPGLGAPTGSGLLVLPVVDCNNTNVVFVGVPNPVNVTTPDNSVGKFVYGVPSYPLGVPLPVGFYQTFLYSVYNTATVVVPDGGTQKLADNSSPLPRDRVFVNYNYFDGAVSAAGGGINRVTPGFEKTFWNGTASIELRAPFASQMDSDQNVTGVINNGNVEFGNLTLYLKKLLYQDCAFAMSAGLGVQLPTADDVRVYGNVGTQTVDYLKIVNESTHLLPFLAGVYAPNSRFYLQNILQLDIDASGNSLYAGGVPCLDPTAPGTPQFTYTPLSYRGTVQAQTFLYESVSVGYWIYKNKCPHARGITGFSPTAELHYNCSLSDQDVVVTQYSSGTRGARNVATLNGIVGANMTLANNKTLTTAYVMPIGGGLDQQFNGELRLMFNWYFGGSKFNGSQPISMVPSR